MSKIGICSPMKLKLNAKTCTEIHVQNLGGRMSVVLIILVRGITDSQKFRKCLVEDVSYKLRFPSQSWDVCIPLLL